MKSPSGNLVSGRGLFLSLIPVWQVRIINLEIFEIYFRCALYWLRRFPQGRGLTSFPQGPSEAASLADRRGGTFMGASGLECVVTTIAVIGLEDYFSPLSPLKCLMKVEWGARRWHKKQCGAYAPLCFGYPLSWVSSFVYRLLDANRYRRVRVQAFQREQKGRTAAPCTPRTPLCAARHLILCESMLPMRLAPKTRGRCRL